MAATRLSRARSTKPRRYACGCTCPHLLRGVGFHELLLLLLTPQLWNSETGQLYHTYRGHATEIVCLSFDPRGTLIATGSMDNTAKLWDVETGKERATLMGHTAEIVSLNFNTAGDRVITGSFDHTVKVWDVKSGKYVQGCAVLSSQLYSRVRCWQVPPHVERPPW